MIAHSQLAPLPNELPFRIVSKTIGQGAYAWLVEQITLHCSCYANYFLIASKKRLHPTVLSLSLL